VTGAAGESPVRRDESADDVFRNMAGGPILGINGPAEVGSRWAEYSQLRVELAQEGHDFVEVVTAAEGHRND